MRMSEKNCSRDKVIQVPPRPVSRPEGEAPQRAVRLGALTEVGQKVRQNGGVHK